MAATAPSNAPPALSDQGVTVKVAFNGSNRKFKIALHDVTLQNFAPKIRSILGVSADKPLVLERFSDSSASFITLDITKPPTYKQLYRAAKAKGKLRLKASVPSVEPPINLALAVEAPIEQSRPVDRHAVNGNAEMSLPAAVPALAPAAVPASAPVPPSQPSRSARLPEGVWQVWCNNCSNRMPNVHFHCSICDQGDYDLCQSCVDAGVLCPGEGHWLIKRFLRNGQPVNSSTERIAPKPRATAQPAAPQISSDMPGAFSAESAAFAAEPRAAAPSTTGLHAKRICNACVRILPEQHIVTCADCEDYDLCIPCHVANRHGHNPAHSFTTAHEDAVLSAAAQSMCAPGRGQRHNAICDGCDKSIYGVRHKCMDCPDWDFCSTCNTTAALTHPDHRFVSSYVPVPAARSSGVIHSGVFCDGLLCTKAKRQTYIAGVRYKCAICNDTDFCAACEAHPANGHNPSHPLIKFKQSIESVSITTFAEDRTGRPAMQMGDACSLPIRKACPATHSQTASAKVKNVELSAEPTNIVREVQVCGQKRTQVAESMTLDAKFIRDSIADGSKLLAGCTFTQSWTLENTGTAAWPVGTRIQFIGGDNMFAAPDDRPMSVSELTEAQQSLPVTRLVLPNETFYFQVKLRVPLREGQHISYWRLKAPDGTPFGHKLWVDIHSVVLEKKSQEEAAIKASVPASPATSHATTLASPSVDTLHLSATQNAMKTSRDSLRDADREIAAHEEPEFQTIKSEVAENVDDHEPVSEDLESSAMVFPVLEKESPSSSTYQDAIPAPPSTIAVEEVPAYSVAPTVTDTETIAERDLESIAYESSDDGFLTDEEYDILDASDEEIINGPRSQV